MTHSHRLTLRDIAKKAGVSYQTVSRVINNHPYVADDTRQRVRDLITELDYHPNRAARSLAGHRANTIALVASDIQDYGPSQVVINIERAAKAAGYDLMIWCCRLRLILLAKVCGRRSTAFYIGRLMAS